MGIVLKQSLNNTIVTYIGFAVGAINTLFLYTRFLTDEYYGLVSVILSYSAILMPILAFGVPNTLVKYFSSFTDKKVKDSFLTLMLLLQSCCCNLICGSRKMMILRQVCFQTCRFILRGLYRGRYCHGE